MRRRDFLATLGASAFLANTTWAQSLPPDLKITRAVGFDLFSQRSKLAGKNARLDVHGNSARDRMVRLYTNVGVEAVGRCWKDKEIVAQLVGTNPFHNFDPGSHQILSPLDRRTMVLWDLAGKLLQKSACEMLGGKPGKVPVYDGSLYFADLLPQYEAHWQDRFKHEIDIAMQAGHRAFKIKIGRGNKWMDREQGDNRDVQVVQTIRRHAGADVLLGVDANNGYDPAGAKRFLQRASDCNLAFFEEPFPEQVEQCLAFKQFIADNGWKSLLADGEGQEELDVYTPYIDAKAVDILQGDMNGFGIELTLAIGRMAAPQGIQIAPHNWGSLLGFYQQLHVGLAMPNFYRAEQDPLSTDVLNIDGYSIADGMCTVPDSPGFGMTINEKKFDRVKVNFDLKA
jgi:L-alanine-DL-glutamate epimerase-like enolase superfamily enzyme